MKAMMDLQYVTFISTGFFSVTKAPREAFQMAIFPFSTMSAFVSVMFFGACRTNRILRIEETSMLTNPSLNNAFIASSRAGSTFGVTGSSLGGVRRVGAFLAGFGPDFGATEACDLGGAGESLGDFSLSFLPFSIASPIASKSK